MNNLVFLDTDVLQALAHKNRRDNIKKILNGISQKSYLAVTCFTRYEFLRGAKPQNKLITLIKILRDFRYFYPQNYQFELARRIYLVYVNAYKKNNPDEGDIMLAASNMDIENSQILTINAKDFPIPLFNVDEKFELRDLKDKYLGEMLLMRIDRKIAINSYNTLIGGGKLI